MSAEMGNAPDSSHMFKNWRDRESRPHLIRILSSCIQLLHKYPRDDESIVKMQLVRWLALRDKCGRSVVLEAFGLAKTTTSARQRDDGRIERSCTALVGSSRFYDARTFPDRLMGESFVRHRNLRWATRTSSLDVNTYRTVPELHCLGIKLKILWRTNFSRSFHGGKGEVSCVIGTWEQDPSEIPSTPPRLY